MKTNLLNECYDKFVTEELKEQAKKDMELFRIKGGSGVHIIVRVERTIFPWNDFEFGKFTNSIRACGFGLALKIDW